MFATSPKIFDDLIFQGAAEDLSAARNDHRLVYRKIWLRGGRVEGFRLEVVDEVHQSETRIETDSVSRGDELYDMLVRFINEAGWELPCSVFDAVLSGLNGLDGGTHASETENVGDFLERILRMADSPASTDIASAFVAAHQAATLTKLRNWRRFERTAQHTCTVGGLDPDEIVERDQWIGYLTRLTATPSDESRSCDARFACNACRTNSSFDAVRSGALITDVTGLRPGDHLQTPRLGVYSHHGIYIGAGEVVHYAGLHSIGEKGPIAITSFDAFRDGNPVRLYEEDGKSPLDRPRFLPEIIVQRARSRLGEDWYSPHGRNCEHFANWTTHGVWYSSQVPFFLK
jgi:hypothetical protein